ncbi:hypothetical protein CXB51_017740 [Gossypium anomalum]|uniref:Retrovirus-related Pol polyprotein from transposon TNT 1-94-like beta-barrel domain-containing protein n=1 Tax=Gossypium anomalum TaxID=47600 RepID=A0A8J5YTP3_9ROSI|nr:hypothetical protein CXB51_017740 [Gossypium anomalum]
MKYDILLLDCNTRFALWQIKMQTVLAQMDLEDVLLRIDKMPSTLTEEEKKHKDQKAFMQLHIYLSNEILQDVMKEKTATAIWAKDTILCSRESLTVDEGYASLISYDKMKHLVERNPHSKSKGRSRSSNKGKTCNFYKKKGHIKSECYKLQNKIKKKAENQKGKQPEQSDEAEVVEDYNDDELLVVSADNSKVSDEWIIDSDCSFHMSSNRDRFTTYETVFEGVVFMGNNASCKIANIGMIKIKMFDGVIRQLSGVQHVPKLKMNLILLSTLGSKGHKCTVKSGVLKISKGSLVVMKGQ